MDGISAITRIASNNIGINPAFDAEILPFDEIFERRMSLAGRNFPLSKEHDVSWQPEGPHHENFSKISEIIAAIKDETPYVTLDNDIKVHRESLFPVLKGISLACQAVDKIISGSAKRAVCITKTEGDVEKAEENLGYAYMSNAAIAAHYALSRNPSWRITMIDFDLGHDCMTKKMMAGVSNVLVMPIFAEGNKKQECLSENEQPCNCRPIRIPKFINRHDLERIIMDRATAEIEEFEPDIVILSVKASDNDGLDCEFMNKGLMELAEKTAGGRFILILEGAVDDDAVVKCESLFGDMAA